MHGREDRKMMEFEQVLAQYEPMISAALRQLNIYRDRDHFRQAGRVALWQAWERYEEGKGHFAPFASRSIRGAMLDMMKQENKFEENVVQTEDDLLASYVDNMREIDKSIEWPSEIAAALAQLTENEKQLIHWLFIEGFTQKEYAEKAKISVAGVKKRRARLLVKLKEKISQEASD